MDMNLPNLLTWLRILLIPLFIGVFYVPDSWLTMTERNITATGLFAIAAIAILLLAIAAYALLRKPVEYPDYTTTLNLTGTEPAGLPAVVSSSVTSSPAWTLVSTGVSSSTLIVIAAGSTSPSASSTSTPIEKSKLFSLLPAV